jgi:hypothetical protein
VKNSDIKNIKPGDKFLYRPQTGKIWKVVAAREIWSFTREYKNHFPAMNIKTKNPENSWIRCYPERDIVIPIPTEVDVTGMSIPTLIALYAPAHASNLEDNKFFAKSRTFNIQINSKNEETMRNLLKLAKENGFKLKPEKHRNVNISEKYTLEEK